MEQKHLNSLKELNLAGLTDNQANKLRDVEKQFNHEFGTDYYFIVMNKESVVAR